MSDVIEDEGFILNNFPFDEMLFGLRPEVEILTTIPFDELSCGLQLCSKLLKLQMSLIPGVHLLKASPAKTLKITLFGKKEEVLYA